MPASVQHLVERASVAVEREDHLGALAEEPLERLLGQSVGMDARRRQRHEVDHVDEADLEVGREEAQQLGSRERLHRDDVAGARQDDVGLAVADGARPLPLRGPARAVLARGGHVEVLQLRLLVRRRSGSRSRGSRTQCSATESRQFASGGRYTRTIAPDSEIIASISPGPWWLNPLWSFRQQVEVSSTFSEATGSRQSRLRASCSHFACCTVIEAETIANAS